MKEGLYCDEGESWPRHSLNAKTTQDRCCAGKGDGAAVRAMKGIFRAAAKASFLWSYRRLADAKTLVSGSIQGQCTKVDELAGDRKVSRLYNDFHSRMAAFERVQRDV